MNTKIIELNVCDDTFHDMVSDDVIHGLLANGYVLTLTPCKYSWANNDTYAIMLEIGGIDPSFIPEPTEESI